MKILKTALKVIFIISLVLALVGCGISFFVSWVWGGIRFSPEAAIETVGLGASEQEYIEAPGYRFYYETVSDGYGDEAVLGDWIWNVTPVAKNGIGMWYANPQPRGYLVRTEGETDIIAKLISVEVNGKYHNFIIPSFSYGDSVSLPEGFPSNCERVSADGNEYELQKHSYFVSDEKPDAFEIDGIKFTVGN